MDAEEVAGTQFRWPEGAPLAVQHTIDLVPGRYEIRAHIVSAGRLSTVTRALDVPSDGNVRIDLFDGSTT